MENKRVIDEKLIYVSREVVNMKPYKIILLFICFSCILLSCSRNTDNEKGQAVEHDLPEELNIWIVSDAVTEYYLSEETENTYYTTMICLGEYYGTTTTYGEQGHMLYHALKKYQEETGITLNIRWYDCGFLLEADLERMSEGERPDLIITSYVSSTADYYRYMDEGYFYDLTKYFDEHEIYISNQYYNQVLKAGEYNKKQYMMPILFNVDTIMGSKQIWEEMGFHISDIDYHSELLDALIYVQNEAEVDQVACQLVSESGVHLPNYIYNASGEKWVDYDLWTVNVDEGIFRKMGVFYKQYLQEQFEDGVIVKGERIPWAKAKLLTMCLAMGEEAQLPDFMKDIGCFVEGGGANQLYLHSAAAQAWYYESRYRDLEHDFEIYAMPGINGGTTAHVSYMGAVLASTKYPEASFDFLKYIMDSETPAFFGLSVNRENTKKQLEYLTNTAYYLRPGLQIRLEDGNLPEGKTDYLIQPMSKETKDKLEAIIEDIENVSLPNCPVYMILEEQLQRYAKNECTIEEAYEKAVEKLNGYVKH